MSSPRDPRPDSLANAQSATPTWACHTTPAVEVVPPAQVQDGAQPLLMSVMGDQPLHQGNTVGEIREHKSPYHEEYATKYLHQYASSSIRYNPATPVKAELAGCTRGFQNFKSMSEKNKSMLLLFFHEQMR